MEGHLRSGHASTEFYLPNYKLGKTLGVGTFGRVKLAEHSRTGHKVAIKILSRRKIRSMDIEEKVRREIKILRLFMHPHIIRLYEVIETHTDIFLVMEFVNSGELFDYIVEKGRLHEDEARRFFQQIISGVEYCHRNKVVHRDLKPENILLDLKCNVKIADFGLSNVMHDGHFLKTSCGSPNYAAPEVISGKLYAGPEVDVWSCGVILYALLCGSLPFDDENIPNLFRKIKGSIYTLPSHLSAGAKDLIPRMLLVDPMKRVTVPEIKQHYWFQVRLPRYLAICPPDTNEQAKRATVMYYLILDSCRSMANGYLGAEFQESREQVISVDSPSSATVPRNYGSPAVSAVSKKWALGLQSRAHPKEIMTEVLKALQELKVSWKKNGQYNMKCRWFPPLPTSKRDQQYHLMVCSGGSLTNMAPRSLQENHFTDGEVDDNMHRDRDNVVKFELQLYKTKDETYLLDLQRVEGSQLLFLDLCVSFLAELLVL